MSKYTLTDLALQVEKMRIAQKDAHTAVLTAFVNGTKEANELSFRTYSLATSLERVVDQIIEEINLEQ